MVLAVENIFLPPILLCLLVAAYMFAALKFPALRFIFRLKGFAARTIGMDEDGNRQLSHTLGLIFCPLIGVGAPLDQQDAKKQEFVGMKFDWECKLVTVEESDGKLRVQATQSRPDPGSSWIICFETDRARLAGVERLPRFVFVRIRGTIVSFEKGIGVQVEELERFQP